MVWNRAMNDIDWFTNWLPDDDTMFLKCCPDFKKKIFELTKLKSFLENLYTKVKLKLFWFNPVVESAPLRSWTKEDENR